jgi:hypothetical protein
VASADGMAADFYPIYMRLHRPHDDALAALSQIASF